jgi:3-deoxy-D-arabino-heptulosonate 7-phosphate (DAHP) synthase class II
VALNGRLVYVVFDSDLATKRGVQAALNALYSKMTPMSHNAFNIKSQAGVWQCDRMPGSVLKVEMTVKTRGFTALKTEACGLTQEAYLHF